MENLNNNNNVNTDSKENQENNESKAEEKLTFTQAELDALLQKTGDQRVSQAMKTLEKKQREADRLRNMTSEEKHEYDLAERERAIEEKEAELARLANKSACIDILTDKGISAKLVDFVLDEDADAMNNKIKLLEREFKASVKAEVEKRLAGKSPIKAPLEQRTSLSKKDIANMPLSELQRLHQEQPELFGN